MVRKGTTSGAGQSTAGGSAGSSRLSLRKSKSKKGGTGYDDCDSQLLQEVIARVVAEGALISFSRTLDGGALVMYIKDGAEESKDYSASPDELEENLRDIHQTYDV